MKNFASLNGLPSATPKGLLATTKGKLSGSKPHNLCGDDIRINPNWLDYNIHRRGSHIYFYEEVNEVTQMILEIMIREAINEVLMEHAGEIWEGELSEPVTIHLNSPGGYLSSGFALYDYIKTSKVPIACVVSGICASAATLIMLACPVRVMSPSSTFLMHQCSWGCWGDNRYMQDHAENAEKAMAKLRKIYLAETGIAKDKSDDERELYIQNILTHDIEFSTEECITLGIINEPEEDPCDVQLSEERLKRLHETLEQLAKEQKEEDAKEKAKSEKKVTKPEKKSGAKKQKPTPKKESGEADKKKKPAKKSEPAPENE